MIGSMCLKELMLIRPVHKERNICQYWHFLDKGFNFQPYFCNGRDKFNAKTQDSQ